MMALQTIITAHLADAFDVSRTACLSSQSRPRLGGSQLVSSLNIYSRTVTRDNDGPEIFLEREREEDFFSFSPVSIIWHCTISQNIISHPS